MLHHTNGVLKPQAQAFAPGGKPTKEAQAVDLELETDARVTFSASAFKHVYPAMLHTNCVAAPIGTKC